jgi:hypothetical protein
MLYIFSSLFTSPPQKIMVSAFPRAPCLSHSPSPSIVPLFAAAYCWLVVVCSIIAWRPPKATMYVFIFLIFLSFHSPPQIIGRCPPRAPPPTRLCYYTPRPLLPSLGCLLGCIIKRWPPKAKAPSSSQYFDGACIYTPNRGTTSGTT